MYFCEGTASTLANCSADVETACNKGLTGDQTTTIEKCKEAADSFR